MDKEYQVYIKELEMENANLKRQVKLLKEESNDNLQMAQKYLMLYMEAAGLDKEKILDESVQNLKKIIER